MKPPYWVAAALALAVWLVYTLDHMIDGYRLNRKSPVLRYAVVYKYRILFGILMGLMASALILIALNFLPLLAIRFGLLIAGFTLLHFLFNFFISARLGGKFFLKEPMIALVVSLSFAGLPALLANQGILISSLHVLALFILNLANLMLFSAFDYNDDIRMEIKSTATIFGLAKVTKLTTALIAVFVLFYSVLYFTGIITLPQLGIFLAMAALLSLILLFRSYFANDGRFRFWGDFIYCLPLIYLMI